MISRPARFRLLVPPLLFAMTCTAAGALMASSRFAGARAPQSEDTAAGSSGSRLQQVRESILTGRLELVWGDAPPSAGGDAGKYTAEKYRFRATLVEDNGARHALDPDRALAAAEDLHALQGLYGRRIAVGVSPVVGKAVAGKPAAGDGVLMPDAIVPIDDLTGPANRGRNVVGKGGIRANAEAISGVTSWVTLMCKFSDQPTEQKTQSFFQSQYGTAVGQLGHYWQEVSYGQINLGGSNAYGWATLPQPRSYYVTFDSTTNKEKADLGKLFQDCTAVHDANVNFAINGGVQGVNMMFNDNLDGYAWGGGQCGTLDGINKCWSTTWNPPWSFGNLAPLSHEMGHAYGLPHANNSDNDSDPYDNPWDVMSDSWNNGMSNATYGTLPKHISMYSRNRLGWVANARKLTVNARNGAQSVVLDRASLVGSNNLQMITLAYPDQSTRYYVIEARMRGGDYENKLAGDAVIIHEVQTSRKEPAWSVDADNPPANRANNEGSMFKVGETWISPDYAFRMTVESATAQGFVVTIKPAPARSLPTPPRRVSTKPAAASSPARTAPAAGESARRFAKPEPRR